MCFAVWTLEHPVYALILCTNRDEYLNRPTKNARFHSFGHEAEEASSNNILSGLDELAGGTWFGLNRNGRTALLTNITEPKVSYVSSRGSLVSSFLLSSHKTENQVGMIVPQDAQFAGFNLLLLAPRLGTVPLQFDASFVTNGGAGGHLTSRPISPEERSLGCFSNGIDGKGGNEWPKVQRGKKEFASVIADISSNDIRTESSLTDRLFELLCLKSDKPVTERSHMRNTINVVPLPMKLDDNPAAWYGTRLSSILLIRKDGSVVFIERDIWKLTDGKVVRADSSDERVFCFQLQL